MYELVTISSNTIPLRHIERHNLRYTNGAPLPRSYPHSGSNIKWTSALGPWTRSMGANFRPPRLDDLPHWQYTDLQSNPATIDFDSVYLP